MIATVRAWPWLSLLVFAAVAAALAVFAAQWSAGAWYATLRKPDWAPPERIMTLLWPILSLPVALAGWLAWRSRDENRTLVLGFWGALLVLGALWPYTLFGRQDLALALVDIGIAWLMAACFMVAGWSVSKGAVLLVIPCWAWASYATALTATMWIGNLERLG